MCDLAYVFEAVHHTLNNASLSQHYLVIDAHELILHILLDFCDDVDTAEKQLVKHGLLYYIALVAIYFPK